MVSKASDDLPEPERPVNTTSRSLGIDRVTFLRLCSRAPRIVIWSVGIRSLSYSFFSCDCKRGAGGGDQAPSPALDAALRDHRPLPGVDDTAGGPQHLSNLGRGDEAQLEIEAHRSRDAGLDGAQRAAHRRVGQGADHATVHETGLVAHVFRGSHLDGGEALAAVDKGEAEPLPGFRRIEQVCRPHRALRAVLPTRWGGAFLIHGPVPRAPPCWSTRRGPPGALARPRRPPRRTSPTA